jgi:molecular chaperone Hsp31 and glyoxalase 3
MSKWFKNPMKSVEGTDGGFNPSPFTIMVGTSKKTKYVKQEYDVKYTGSKPILVVCTDEALMEMQNKKKFSTGNHPVEMYVPMLHLRDAGFDFEFATLTGGDVKLEMWAFPTKDENVKNLHEEMKAKMDDPKKISDITSLDDYSAIFIPGGHGSMINLPFSADLGKLLHLAHVQAMPTVTLCHGPSALLSTAEGGQDFAYDGYKIMCFTDKTDAQTPSVGYLPGHMPWKVQEALENKGVTILNKSETGAVTQDRELITGDSPTAAHNLGKFAAPIVAKWAVENKM